MKILLISGHGAGDPGACANGYQEADLTIEVVNTLAAMLRNYANVTIYPVERNAYADIKNGKLQVNFADYDYVFEVHFNAGGGTGTEIYVTSKEKATTVEKAVVAKLEAYFKNRGVKPKDFLVINTAKNKGVSSALLEVCFIDNANDVATYQSHKNEICQSICNGIVEGFRLGKVSQPTPPTPQPPQPTTEYLNLDPSVALRTVYNANLGQVGKIKPQKYGGLSYVIHGYSDSNRYVTIKTGSFGMVKICIDKAKTGDTFTISNTRQYVNGD